MNSPPKWRHIQDQNKQDVISSSFRFWIFHMKNPWNQVKKLILFYTRQRIKSAISKVKEKNIIKQAWHSITYRLFFVRSTYFAPINPKYNDWFCQIYKDLNKLFVNLTKSVLVFWVNWWQNMLIWQRITCNWKIQSNFTNIQKWMQYRFEIGRRLFYASLVLKIPISNLMVVIGKFLHRNFLIQAS